VCPPDPIHCMCSLAGSHNAQNIFIFRSVQICMNLVVYQINVPFVLRNMVESLIST